MPDAASVARGVSKPRRPQASPLFRLVSDHLHRLQTVYDDRFARAYGPWRPVVALVADKFLTCGVLDHGFARIRCDACTHEYLLAFSCTCRYCCPSCHAKRLAIWTQWLDTTLLAPPPAPSRPPFAVGDRTPYSGDPDSISYPERRRGRVALSSRRIAHAYA